jgi:hypothetical protein
MHLCLFSGKLRKQSMNKQNAKDYLPFVQALAEGKDVQININTESSPIWTSPPNLEFGFHPEYYRIKPEPQEFWIIEWFDGDRDLCSTQIDAEGSVAGVHKSQYKIIHVREVTP